jgi:hypothetical protein
MDICNHICIYASINAYVVAYIRICQHICIYATIYAYMLAYMDICNHICIYASTIVHGCACTIVHGCASVHCCACTIAHGCASVHGCRAEASPDARSYVLPPSPPPPPSPAALLFAWSAAGRRLTRRSVSIWPEGHDHKVQRPSLSVWHNLSKRGNKKTRGLQCLADVLLEPARMSLPLSLGYDTSSTTIRSMPG